jgi:hypothetical protein
MLYTVSKNEIGGPGDDCVLICDLHTDLGDDRAWWYGGMPHQMTPPLAKLKVNAFGNQIILSSDVYARIVTLDADLDFSDNYFDLLPGEEKTVTWSQRINEPLAEAVTVRCWNSSAVICPLVRNV